MGTLTKVANKMDLPDGKAVSVTVGSKHIAVFNVGGRFYAIDDECTHAGGPLSEGEVQGTIVTCPWHGATFDVMTGGVLSEPAPDNVGTYKVVVEGEDIKVEV